MTKIKKIINDPEHIVPEVIDGLVLAAHGRLKKVDGVNALMLAEIPARLLPRLGPFHESADGPFLLHLSRAKRGETSHTHLLLRFCFSCFSDSSDSFRSFSISACVITANTPLSR